MNFFHHKDLGNHFLQLCPKVVKHSVYVRFSGWSVGGKHLLSFRSYPLQTTFYLRGRPVMIS